MAAAPFQSAPLSFDLCLALTMEFTAVIDLLIRRSHSARNTTGTLRCAPSWGTELLAPRQCTPAEPSFEIWSLAARRAACYLAPRFRVIQRIRYRSWQQ
jgi:hypothetical protein